VETAELLKKVRHIEIKTRGLSNHLFAGEYHSVFKGRGMAFSEVREYQYGDDIRSIDWNVTARFNTPYVKVFEEERELTVMLLIDVSQSDYYGTRVQAKNILMTEIAAVLSFSAIKNDDKVGVIFFSDKIEEFIPPQKGKKHILRIIRQLLNFEPSGIQTNISEALRYFNNIVKKRSIAFLMSDFIDSGYDKALSIAARRHDLIGLRIFDISEQELPKLGFGKFYDPEKKKYLWIDTSAKKYREAYRNWHIKNMDYMETSFIKAGAELLSVRTDESYVQPLIRFFKKRTRR